MKFCTQEDILIPNELLFFSRIDGTSLISDASMNCLCSRKDWELTKLMEDGIRFEKRKLKTMPVLRFNVESQNVEKY
jgi:predicted  nucleic acid-binding Zn ribbon protein